MAKGLSNTYHEIDITIGNINRKTGFFDLYLKNIEFINGIMRDDTAIVPLKYHISIA